MPEDKNEMPDLYKVYFGIPFQFSAEKINRTLISSSHQELPPRMIKQTLYFFRTRQYLHQS